MPLSQPVITFTSPIAGPKVLILGAVHGHEPCGSFAIARLRAEIDAGVVQLRSGTLTLMPICNPLAYSKHVRYVKEDLNRIIRTHKNPEHDEQVFANAVVEQIAACDVVLDLHSATTGKGPSLFLDYPTPENRDLSLALGVGPWVVGWPAVYGTEKQLDQDDTMGCAAAHGKRGVFVECGQHAEPEAPQAGYDVIRRLLNHLQVMDYDCAPAAPPHQVAVMKKIVLRDKPGTFAAQWQHLQPVPAGTVIIEYDDGTTYMVETDSVLVLPKPYAKPGHEWIYIAEAQAVSQTLA